MGQSGVLWGNGLLCYFTLICLIMQMNRPNILVTKWLLVQQEVGQWLGYIRARDTAMMCMRVH